MSIAIDEEDGLATSADGANGSHAAASSEAARAGSKRSHPTNATDDDDDEDLVLFDSQPDREAATFSNKRARADETAETAETRSDAASAEASSAPTTTKEAMPTFKVQKFKCSLCS